jgi:hypothetical protein
MFKEFLKTSKTSENEYKDISDNINEAEKDIDKILSDIRKKVKIKTIIPTKFGIEIVLFNPDDAEKAAKIAGTKDIDGNSIFIKG